VPPAVLVMAVLPAMLELWKLRKAALLLVILALPAVAELLKFTVPALVNVAVAAILVSLKLTIAPALLVIAAQRKAVDSIGGWVTGPEMGILAIHCGLGSFAARPRITAISSAG
jgi:hypothetical protein